MNRRDLSVLKDRIEFVKTELGNENSTLVNRLSEKGVECTILVPIFEHIFGFDIAKAVSYTHLTLPTKA